MFWQILRPALTGISISTRAICGRIITVIKTEFIGGSLIDRSGVTVRGVHHLLDFWRFGLGLLDQLPHLRNRSNRAVIIMCKRTTTHKLLPTSDHTSVHRWFEACSTALSVQRTSTSIGSSFEVTVVDRYAGGAVNDSSLCSVSTASNHSEKFVHISRTCANESQVCGRRQI